MKRAIPSDEKLGDAGRLILRLAVGAMMLLHGIDKLLHGIPGIRTSIENKGLPPFFANGVYVGEVIAPILILVGWMSRPAALVLAINMVVAIALSHAKDAFRLGNHGQVQLELQYLYLCGGLAIALLGPGHYSASRGRSRLG